MLGIEAARHRHGARFGPYVLLRDWSVPKEIHHKNSTCSENWSKKPRFLACLRESRPRVERARSDLRTSDPTPEGSPLATTFGLHPFSLRRCSPAVSVIWNRGQASRIDSLPTIQRTGVGNEPEGDSLKGNHNSVAFCSAESLTFSGLVETPLVGSKS